MAHGALTLQTYCFDLDAMSRFMKAVSFAQAVAERTQTRWVPDEEAARFLYGLPGQYHGASRHKGMPGSQEVSTNWAKVEARVTELTQQRMAVFFEKCFMGPAAVTKYIRDTEKIRRIAESNLRDIYADLDALNKEVAGRWSIRVKRAADLKLGATLVVKGIGQIPGPPMLVDIGFDIVVACVEPGAGSDKNTSVAVRGFEAVSKEGIEVGTSKAGEKAADLMNRGSTAREFNQALTNLNQANDRLAAKHHKILHRQNQIAHGIKVSQANQSLKTLTKQADRAAKTADKMGRRAMKAGVKAAAGQAVGWFWLGTEILDAVEAHQGAQAAAEVGASRKPAPPAGRRLTR